MKFGIVVCPRCKNVKGVNLSFKTTRCIGCGKILLLKKIRIMYQTNSEHELKQAIGLINAEKDGKLKEYKNLIKKTIKWNFIYVSY